MEPGAHFAVSVHRDSRERRVVAEIQRLENAARIAMGDIQDPDQTTPQPQPLPNASTSLVIAVLGVIGVGLLAVALI
jgi:signal recognition particle GTPase